ncbi:MAG: metallophosphoesterase family protein [Bifidobacterium sp.]|nr:metallophosphoesterase family protein [Bifidobacterium sp.]
MVTSAVHEHAQVPQQGGSRPLSVSARLGRLQFHNSGKFRVLQLTDIQSGPKLDKDTITLISACIDAAKPDLAVFSGNQIAGYDTAYSATFRKRRWSVSWNRMKRQNADRFDADLEHTRELVRSEIGQFVQPLIDRGIPWAVTYGNHDFQCGLDNAEMDAIYREFPGCLNPESTAASLGHPRIQPASGLPDQRIYPCEPGTFALPVTDVERNHTVLGLVLLDSGDYAHLGGYGEPSERGLAFLRTVPRLIDARAMVFQHLPLPQYYDLLRQVPPTKDHAVEGYRAFSGRYYVIDEGKTLPGSYLGEGVSCPDHDCGQFELMRSGSGYFALSAGHDHRNGFVGTLDGILLAASPTCGFGSYGTAPARRAARLFEFDIRHPEAPRTQLLEFGELAGKPSSRKAYTYALNSTAASPGETMDLLRKPGLISRVVKRLRKPRGE